MTATFHPDYPIEKLQGAAYNPRRIDDETIAALAKSLETLGIVKPVIVAREVIVAGHQRTRALRKLGRTTAPVVLLDGKLGPADEIRFNQLHNGTDLDMGDEVVEVGGGPIGIFEMCAVEGTGGKGANVRTELCRLINRYGNWGAVVADERGRVFHAAQYALACYALRLPVRVYRVPDALLAQARAFLGRGYGVFSYEHLDRTSYVQSFAQLPRLRHGDDPDVRQNRSSLYERMVLPDLLKSERVLDFGAGQCDYAKKLAAAGYRIFPVEFFHRDVLTNTIATGAVRVMVDRALQTCRRDGRFDVCLADSVLNSVDTPQAESDVLTCLNAFCKPGGRVYFSGRTRAREERRNEVTRFRGKSREKGVSFLDATGFSGVYHRGHWFFQKFHSPAEVRALVERHFPGAEAAIKFETGGWFVRATKAGELPPEMVESALRREFNLPWPEGRTVGKADAAVTAWRAHTAAGQRPSSGRS